MVGSGLPRRWISLRLYHRAGSCRLGRPGQAGTPILTHLLVHWQIIYRDRISLRLYHRAGSDRRGRPEPTITPALSNSDTALPGCQVQNLKNRAAPDCHGAAPPRSARLGGSGSSRWPGASLSTRSSLVRVLKQLWISATVTVTASEPELSWLRLVGSGSFVTRTGSSRSLARGQSFTETV